VPAVGEGDKWYELVEEESFAEAMAALGGAQYLEPALAALAGSLVRNNVRLAKTKAGTIGEDHMPALRLWFTVGTGKEPEGEDDGCVYLLYIEAVSEEDPWADE